jgi:DNA polymerase-1
MQSRYIEAAVRGIIVACVYAPIGNPQPGAKFQYKLAWMKRLNRHAASLIKADLPVVLAGDFNVVPTPFDIYKTTSYDKDALLQPETRAAYRRLLKQGWTDAVRKLHPDEPMFTFWDYMRQRWQRDAGLRIDHLLLSPSLAKRLDRAGVDRQVRDKPDASDHAPVWMMLRDEDSDARRATRAAVPAGARAATRAVAPSAATAKKRPLLVIDGASKPAAKRSAPSRTAARKARPLLVIDGDSFAHRAYHALPKNIKRDRGKGAGAILGFANFLLRFYQTEQPRAVVVGWDTLSEPTYRHESFPDYQSGREFDESLVQQLEVLPDFVAACGFANVKAAGYEADDFLAAAAAAEERRRGLVLIASGDRDTFQLASARTTILYPVRAGEVARIGPEQVRERYGVDPKQVPDFVALRGDPSDKLPGARGVGAQSAADLVRRFGTLEKVLRSGRFANQAKELRLYRQIATMDRKAPLPSLATQQPTWDKAAALARRWQLNNLAGRLEALARAQT